MLRQELKDSNIPHRLTICKWIDEVLEEHLTWLEEDMQVSWHSTSKFISYWWACKFRQHWVWSPKQWISGQIQTVHHTWWWLVIGSKEYIRKPSMAPGSHSSSGLISSVSNKSLVTMMGSTLPQLSCTLQIVLRLLTRWDINAQLCIFYSYKIGWVTLDNATNNDTFFAHLGQSLRQWGIKFNHIEWQIRYIPEIPLYLLQNNLNNNLKMFSSYC